MMQLADFPSPVTADVISMISQEDGSSPAASNNFGNSSSMSLRQPRTALVPTECVRQVLLLASWETSKVMSLLRCHLSLWLRSWGCSVSKIGPRRGDAQATGLQNAPFGNAVENSQPVLLCPVLNLVS